MILNENNVKKIITDTTERAWYYLATTFMMADKVLLSCMNKKMSLQLRAIQKFLQNPIRQKISDKQLSSTMSLPYGNGFAM